MAFGAYFTSNGGGARTRDYMVYKTSPLPTEVHRPHSHPMQLWRFPAALVTGLEPAASALTERHSNQLSYTSLYASPRLN